jgi:hypothetical protein
MKLDLNVKLSTEGAKDCRGIPSSGTGLPDGIFSNPKSQFGCILEGLRIENVVTFYGHLEYFTAILQTPLFH